MCDSDFIFWLDLLGKNPVYIFVFLFGGRHFKAYGINVRVFSAGVGMLKWQPWNSSQPYLKMLSPKQFDKGTSSLSEFYCFEGAWDKLSKSFLQFFFFFLFKNQDWVQTRNQSLRSKLSVSKRRSWKAFLGKLF